VTRRLSRLVAPVKALILVTLVASAGCASNQETAEDPVALEASLPQSPRAGRWGFLGKILSKKPPAPPVASAAVWTGVIRMVNVAESFVLLESQSPTSAIPGEKYHSVQKGVETGTLRMSTLKNPPFLIADILSGNPSPGDKIYLPSPTFTPLPNPTPTLAPSPETARQRGNRASNVP
jgi:hypothetical protein